MRSDPPRPDRLARSPAPASRGVHLRPPPRQLGLEVVRTIEGVARQERGLQVAIGAFGQPLGLGIGRLADDHLGAKSAAECLALAGQVRAATSPSPARPAVGRPEPWRIPLGRSSIVHRPANSPQPPASPTAARSAARVARHHHQYRQLHRRPGLTKPNRHAHLARPEVTLRQFARLIRRA